MTSNMFFFIKVRFIYKTLTKKLLLLGRTRLSSELFVNHCKMLSRNYQMDLFIGERYKENGMKKSLKEEERDPVKREADLFGYVSHLLQKKNIQAMSRTISMMDFKDLQNMKPKSKLDVRRPLVICTEDLNSKIIDDLKGKKLPNNDNACSYYEILIDIRKLFVEEPRKKLSPNFSSIDIIVDIRRLFQETDDATIKKNEYDRDDSSTTEIIVDIRKLFQRADLTKSRCFDAIVDVRNLFEQAEENNINDHEEYLTDIWKLFETKYTFVDENDFKIQTPVSKRSSRIKRRFKAMKSAILRLACCK